MLIKCLSLLNIPCIYLNISSIYFSHQHNWYFSLDVKYCCIFELCKYMLIMIFTHSKVIKTVLINNEISLIMFMLLYNLFFT